MRIVAASLLDRSTRDQIRASLGGHVHVEMYSSRDHALTALRRMPAAALLTDLGADRGLPVDAFVRVVRQRSPTLPLVAVVHLTSPDVRALLRIAPIGVEGVIAVGVDSPWMVLQSILTPPAIDASIEAVLAVLRPRVSDHAWPVVAFAVRAAKAPMTVDDWSANLGVQRTTLLRRLHGASLPAPATVLALGRLLVAAYLVGVHRWTVRQPAEALHYSSASALRKSLRLRAGIRPHQTRAVGGIDRLFDAVGAGLGPSFSVRRLA
jgi:hypothetical protein